MSEQENAEATAKPRRNRRTHKQNSAQSPALSRPTNDDYKGWKAYWEAQGQPWRTEPEIDEERQKDLESRRSITPDMSFILGGFLLFKGVKLSRADVEWLLATHEDGRGPIDWNDDSQKKRKGLVLFGADLGHVDLSELPLARIAGSPKEAWMYMYDRPQMEAAAIHLEGADLMGAFFDGTTELASVVLCNKFNAKETYLPNYRYYEPARAYRQLTVVLRNQGLNEQADHF